MSDADTTANWRKAITSPEGAPEQTGDDTLVRALSLVAEERIRQDEKWGSDVERIPSLARDTEAYGDGGEVPNPWTLMHYGVPSVAELKATEQALRAAGQENFASTALEELGEAIEAAGESFPGDDERVLREVTQLGAVCVKWIQAILRRMKREQPR